MNTYAQLDAAREHLGWSYEDLWVAYYRVGGDYAPRDVEAWLNGQSRPSLHDYDLVACALNERFADRGIEGCRVPYSGDV